MDIQKHLNLSQWRNGKYRAFEMQHIVRKQQPAATPSWYSAPPREVEENEEVKDDDERDEDEDSQEDEMAFERMDRVVQADKSLKGWWELLD